METIDVVIIGLISTIIICCVVILSFWEYSQKQKCDILHQKALVKVLRFRLRDKQDDSNNKSKN